MGHAPGRVIPWLVNEEPAPISGAGYTEEVKGYNVKPKTCDNCRSRRVVYRHNTIRSYYACVKCKATVGVHPGTDIPLGYMAPRHIRALRKQCHDVFDMLWLDKLMTRGDAYKWLARKLGLHDVECHIGQLDEKQLQDAIRFSAAHYRKTAIKARRAENDKDNDRPAPTPKRYATKRRRSARRRANARKRDN